MRWRRAVAAGVLGAPPGAAAGGEKRVVSSCRRGPPSFSATAAAARAPPPPPWQSAQSWRIASAACSARQQLARATWRRRHPSEPRRRQLGCASCRCFRPRRTSSSRSACATCWSAARTRRARLGSRARAAAADARAVALAYPWSSAVRRGWRGGRACLHRQQAGRHVSAQQRGSGRRLGALAASHSRTHRDQSAAAPPAPYVLPRRACADARALRARRAPPARRCGSCPSFRTEARAPPQRSSGVSVPSLHACSAAAKLL